MNIIQLQRKNVNDLHTINEITEDVLTRLTKSGYNIKFFLNKYYALENRAEFQYHLKDGENIEQSELERILYTNNTQAKTGSSEPGENTQK